MKPGWQVWSACCVSWNFSAGEPSSTSPVHHSASARAGAEPKFERCGLTFLGLIPSRRRRSEGRSSGPDYSHRVFRSRSILICLRAVSIRFRHPTPGHDFPMMARAMRLSQEMCQRTTFLDTLIFFAVRREKYRLCWGAFSSTHVATGSAGAESKDWGEAVANRPDYEYNPRPDKYRSGDCWKR